MVQYVLTHNTHNVLSQGWAKYITECISAARYRDGVEVIQSHSTEGRAFP